MEKHHPIKLAEDELESIFRHPEEPKKVGFVFAWLKTLVSFVVVFGLIFVFINFPAYWQKTRQLVLTKTDDTLVTNEATPIFKIKDQTEGKRKQLDTRLKAKVPADHLVIPSLNIDVPIGWDVPFDQIISRLADGVVHYGGTALPSEVGNVFIVGHSSNYWWDKGRFNQIFAVLNNIEAGSRIYLNYKDQVYVYEVGEKTIVNPTEISVLNSTNQSTISLMTCYPVGTTLKRLIVKGTEIYPQNGTNQTPNDLLPPDSLPAIR